MRLASLLILCACLFLAACGGAAEPTPAPTPAEVDTAPPSTPSELGIIAQTVAVPPRGELGYIDTSGTPGVPQPLQFDIVQLEIRSANSSESTIINISSDGTVLRNDVPVQVDPAAIETLCGMLDQINFFQIDGVFAGEGSVTQGNRYFLTVNGSTGSRMITADDQYTPSELLAIFTLIQSLGESAPVE